jgi:phosphonate transport system ATP-binding protein
MQAGKVRFDGTPAELTDERVRDIYGTEGLEAGLDENVTSTSITATAAE